MVQFEFIVKHRIMKTYKQGRLETASLEIAKQDSLHCVLDSFNHRLTGCSMNPGWFLGWLINCHLEEL